MEFLDNFVLPQSTEHILLLQYMLILVLVLFISFVSVLFGGTFLSLRFKRKGLKNQDSNALRFAKQIMEIVTINKSVGFILGFIPLLTAILIYAQLLHTATTSNLLYLTVALALLVIALILIYSYRYSLTFNEIFNSIDSSTLKDEDISKDISYFFEESSRISKKAGSYGLLFLFLAIWMFVVAVTIPVHFTDWESSGFIADIFNWKVLANLFYYLLAAFALTGGFLLFNFFESEKYRDRLSQNYKGFVKKTCIRITLTPAIILPIFMLINLLAIPGESLSTSVFGYLLIALFLLFIGYHFIYILSQKENRTISALLFFVMLFSLSTFIISNQVVMSNSTKVQSAALNLNFVEYLKELKGDGTEVELNGEEIYTVRCASCHKFEEKLVGPPHFEILPKYEGNEAKLVAFIRNPVKVDPAYPPMPNPGLKPNEAEAVAKYLLKTYEEKKQSQ